MNNRPPQKKPPTKIRLLRVKVKSLAAEAKIIRDEEAKAKTAEEKRDLHLHRTKDLRRAQRAALLAYGFLRGRSLLRCEPASRHEPDWPEVERLIKKFGVLAWTFDFNAQMAAYKNWAASWSPMKTN